MQPSPEAVPAAVSADQNDQQAGVQALPIETILAELQLRCEAAKIPFKQTHFFEQDSSTVSKELKGLMIRLPPDRGIRLRAAFIDSDARARALFEVPFEQYVFLGDYEAICSVGEQFIEANIEGAHDSRAMEAGMLSRLFGAPGSSYPWYKDAVAIEIVPSGESVKKVRLIPPPGLRLGQLASALQRISLPQNRRGFVQHTRSGGRPS